MVMMFEGPCSNAVLLLDVRISLSPSPGSRSSPAILALPTEASKGAPFLRLLSSAAAAAAPRSAGRPRPRPRPRGSACGAQRCAEWWAARKEMDQRRSQGGGKL